MDIILVSGATSRARTITLDWRHLTAGSLALFILFVVFTLLFNYVTLRYAAATIRCSDCGLRAMQQGVQGVADCAPAARRRQPGRRPA